MSEAMSILNEAAVGSRSGEDAGKILQAYIATTPAMVLNHTISAAPDVKPRVAAAAPGMSGGPGLGGSSASAGRAAVPAVDPVVSEYEVFKNERNALAFFFFHHPVSDQNKAEGPFWFTIEADHISAGTETHHVLFEDIKREVLDIARQRGVIMLVEFENQQPVRCTPCYLTDMF